MTGYPLLYPPLWPALLLIAVAGLPFAAVATAQTTLLQTPPGPPYAAASTASPPPRPEQPS